MKTKKQAIKIVSFFLLLTIAIYLLSVVFTPTDTQSGGVADEPADSLDYLAIGDSECRYSISPMELWKAYGYAGYNCGVDGQWVQDTYYQLEKTLENQSPKVVLIETDVIYLNLASNQEPETVFDDFIANKVALYKYHNKWKQFLFSKTSTESQRGSNVFKGTEYITKAVPYEGGSYVTETDKVQEIGTVQRIYLDKIVALCKEKNIQLVLYCVPSPKCWLMAAHNAIAAYAEENGLPFLDLNLITEELGIDWSNDTFDGGGHLNFYGELKVTDYIGMYLQEHTTLPDHLSDADYAVWNDELKAYLESTGQEA